MGVREISDGEPHAPLVRAAPPTAIAMLGGVAIVLAQRTVKRPQQAKPE